MKTLSKMSLRKQMIIITMISSVIPLLLLSVFSLGFMNRVIEENTEKRLDEVLHSVNDILAVSIKNQKTSLDNIHSLFNEDDLLSDTTANKNKISNLMHQFMMVDGAMMNMYLVNSNGDYVGTSNLPNRYHLPLYKDWGIFNKTENTKEVFFYPNYGQNSERFYNSYSLIKKLESGDETLYLILDVSTEYVQKQLSTVRGNDLGYVQIILTASTNEIIYNDSMFTSPISYLGNVFRYDRINASDNIDINNKLEEVNIRQYTNEYLQLNMYGIIPKSMFSDQTNLLGVSMSILIVITAIISGVLGYILTKQFSKPIYEIVEKMKEYRPFNMENYKDKTSNNELKELQHQFDKLIKRIEKYNDEDLRKQELLRMAEIKSLMSQINPHFLNNTLDSVKWKAKLAGEEEIADMITDLSSLLQASMNTQHYVTIKEEIDFVESYIGIQVKRYGHKLTYESDIKDDVLDYMIPKLIIQPIIENAIIHGLEPLEEGGIILLRIEKDEEYLYLEITDNGVGSDDNFDKDEESIGIKNVKDRIFLHYGDKSSLEFRSRLNVGTTVVMKIPLSELEGYNV